MEKKQNNLAERFLLGKLTEAETIEIENEIFSKNERFENILMAENDLIDAYVSGNLSVEDNALFESRLLINSRQCQRVEFAKMLANYTSRLTTENRDSLSYQSNWLQSFSRLFSIKPLFSYSFAMVAFAILGGAVWLAVNSSLLRLPDTNEMAHTTKTTERESAVEKPESNATNEQQKPDNKVNTQSALSKDKSSSAERSPKVSANESSTSRRIEQPKKPATLYSTIVLPFGLTRGDNTGATEFDVPAKADFVKLKLKLEESDFAAYFAVIETVEGQKIWSGRIPKSAVSKNEKTVIATVPGRLLKKGDYIIALKGLTKEQTYESAGDYSFSINRK